MTVINTNVGALQRGLTLKRQLTLKQQWKDCHLVFVLTQRQMMLLVCRANKMESQLRGMNMAIRTHKMVFHLCKLLKRLW